MCPTNPSCIISRPLETCEVHCNVGPNFVDRWVGWNWASSRVKRFVWITLVLLQSDIGSQRRYVSMHAMGSKLRCSCWKCVGRHKSLSHCAFVTVVSPPLRGKAMRLMYLHTNESIPPPRTVSMCWIILLLPTSFPFRSTSSCSSASRRHQMAVGTWNALHRRCK